MYGSGIGEGLGGCLKVMAVLSVIGIVTLAAGAWWLISNISISWGGA